MIRFISAKDISLGFEFTVQPIRKSQDAPVVNFTVAIASPLLGYDSNGEFINKDLYTFIADSGDQVDDIEDASVLASGVIFPQLIPELHGDVEYLVSFYGDASLRKRELRGFLEIIASDFIDDVYKEILRNG